MQIDLLYFDDCPSWQRGLENLKIALAREGIDAEINLVRIDDDAKAAQMKFLGSPSFHVNGVELWLEEREAYNLSCRVYQTPAGMKGTPSIEMLQEKLHTHKL